MGGSPYATVGGITHCAAKGKRLAEGNEVLLVCVRVSGSGIWYSSGMDEMLNIPKDRPKRHPFVLVVLLAIAAIMLAVRYLG
jgi:hypothetical protein